MATKRKRSVVPGNSFFVGVGQHNNFFSFDDLEEDQKVILMAAHLELMQNFINFCKEKKDKCDQEKLCKPKDSLCGEQFCKINEFKEEVTTNFGHYLPSHVVDSLCNFVEENSNGHHCSLSTDRLVLHVLQILADASQSTHEAHTTNFFSKAHAPINDDSVIEKSINTNIGNGRHPLSDKGYHQSVDKIHSGSEGTKSLSGKIKANGLPVLDTPVFLLGQGLDRNTFVSSQQAPLMPINPKSKPNHFVAKLHPPIANSVEVEPPYERCRKSVHLSSKVSPEVRILKETNPKASCLDLRKIAEQVYNQKTLNNLATKVQTKNFSHPGARRIPVNGHQHQFEYSNRFAVSKSEMGYYKVLCGLAKSQWKNHEGVMLHKTSVTYSSLGESIEPLGHVDNFFIAGYCRKLFDDIHPRESKKHFFYPRIGGCLLSYTSDYDVSTVKSSFIGANSALKLHKADKLCFPIFHPNVKHWSVFIVDLNMKIFAFLDSMFGENDAVQIDTRRRIIPAFKECWYEHAEVKLDLEDFDTKYPAVPKQNNVHDCGIFAIMFMELWDNNVDLRNVFDQSDIPNIRVKIGNALFFSKKNAVDKTLVQNLFEQGIDPQVCA